MLRDSLQDLGASGRGRGRGMRPAQWQPSQPGMGPPPPPVSALGAQQAALRPGRAQPQVCGACLRPLCLKGCEPSMAKIPIYICAFQTCLGLVSK